MSRLVEMIATRNRLNDLGTVVVGFWLDIDGQDAGTAYLYPHGSEKDRKRIRVRNKLNARIRAALRAGGAA